MEIGSRSHFPIVATEYTLEINAKKFGDDRVYDTQSTLLNGANSSVSSPAAALEKAQALFNRVLESDPQGNWGYGLLSPQRQIDALGKAVSLAAEVELRGFGSKETRDVKVALEQRVGWRDRAIGEAVMTALDANSAFDSKLLLNGLIVAIGKAPSQDSYNSNACTFSMYLGARAERILNAN